ncbi:MAG: hypothetical protein WC763_05865 [Candidatus Paceibacterota bacterium]|jgi:serine/threonine protein kinase
MATIDVPSGGGGDVYASSRHHPTNMSYEFSEMVCATPMSCPDLMRYFSIATADNGDGGDDASAVSASKPNTTFALRLRRDRIDAFVDLVNRHVPSAASNDALNASATATYAMSAGLDTRTATLMHMYATDLHPWRHLSKEEMLRLRYFYKARSAMTISPPLPAMRSKGGDNDDVCIYNANESAPLVVPGALDHQKAAQGAGGRRRGRRRRERRGNKTSDNHDTATALMTEIVGYNRAATAWIESRKLQVTRDIQSRAAAAAAADAPSASEASSTNLINTLKYYPFAQLLAVDTTTSGGIRGIVLVMHADEYDDHENDRRLDMLSRMPLPTVDALRPFHRAAQQASQIGLGLANLHACGMAHLDVKGANILSASDNAVALIYRAKKMDAYDRAHESHDQRQARRIASQSMGTNNVEKLIDLNSARFVSHTPMWVVNTDSSSSVVAVRGSGSGGGGGSMHKHRHRRDKQPSSSLSSSSPLLSFVTKPSVQRHQHIAQSKAPFGTRGCEAPEQCIHDSEVFNAHAADIYALGVMLGTQLTNTAGSFLWSPVATGDQWQALVNIFNFSGETEWPLRWRLGHIANAIASRSLADADTAPATGTDNNSEENEEAMRVMSELLHKMANPCFYCQECIRSAIAATEESRRHQQSQPIDDAMTKSMLLPALRIDDPGMSTLHRFVALNEHRQIATEGAGMFFESVPRIEARYVSVDINDDDGGESSLAQDGGSGSSSMERTDAMTVMCPGCNMYTRGPMRFWESKVFTNLLLEFPVYMLDTVRTSADLNAVIEANVLGPMGEDIAAVDHHNTSAAFFNGGGVGGGGGDYNIEAFPSLPRFMKRYISLLRSFFGAHRRNYHAGIDDPLTLRDFDWPTFISMDQLISGWSSEYTQWWSSLCEFVAAYERQIDENASSTSSSTSSSSTSSSSANSRRKAASIDASAAASTADVYDPVHRFAYRIAKATCCASRLVRHMMNYDLRARPDAIQCIVQDCFELISASAPMYVRDDILASTATPIGDIDSDSDNLNVFSERSIVDISRYSVKVAEAYQSVGDYGFYKCISSKDTLRVLMPSEAMIKTYGSVNNKKHISASDSGDNNNGSGDGETTIKAMRECALRFVPEHVIGEFWTFVNNLPDEFYMSIFGAHRTQVMDANHLQPAILYGFETFKSLWAEEFEMHVWPTCIDELTHWHHPGASHSVSSSSSSSSSIGDGDDVMDVVWRSLALREATTNFAFLLGSCIVHAAQIFSPEVGAHIKTMCFIVQQYLVRAVDAPFVAYVDDVKQRQQRQQQQQQIEPFTAAEFKTGHLTLQKTHLVRQHALVPLHSNGGGGGDDNGDDAAIMRQLMDTTCDSFWVYEKDIRSPPSSSSSSASASRPLAATTTPCILFGENGVEENADNVIRTLSSLPLTSIFQKSDSAVHEASSLQRLLLSKSSSSPSRERHGIDSDDSSSSDSDDDDGAAEKKRVDVIASMASSSAASLPSLDGEVDVTSRPRVLFSWARDDSDNNGGDKRGRRWRQQQEGKESDDSGRKQRRVGGGGSVDATAVDEALDSEYFNEDYPVDAIKIGPIKAWSMSHLIIDNEEPLFTPGHSGRVVGDGSSSNGSGDDSGGSDDDDDDDPPEEAPDSIDNHNLWDMRTRAIQSFQGDQYFFLSNLLDCAIGKRCSGAYPVPQLLIWYEGLMGSLIDILPTLDTEMVCNLINRWYCVSLSSDTEYASTATAVKDAVDAPSTTISTTTATAARGNIFGLVFFTIIHVATTIGGGGGATTAAIAATTADPDVFIDWLRQIIATLLVRERCKSQEAMFDEINVSLTADVVAFIVPDRHRVGVVGSIIRELLLIGEDA